MAHPTLPIAETGERDVLSVLVQAARAMHAASDEDALVGWATAALLQVSGGTAAAVCRFQAAESPVWTVAGTPDLRIVGDPRSHQPLLPAARGDAVVRCDDTGTEWEGTAFAFYLPDAASIVAAPVLKADGTAQGVAIVTHPESGRFDSVTEQGVLALTAHLGVALDNHAEFDAVMRARTHQGELVEHLQEAVEPPMPTVPHTELGVSYQAAEPGVPTGGDLWDWLLLPDGDLHLAVVDVEGKGVTATKDALAIVHALRMLTLDGCSLLDLVRRADALLTPPNPDLVATIVVARYSPDTGRLLVAGAGHPPPLVIRGDTVEEIMAPGIPLGWPGAGSEIVAETQLDRSDTALFYTDGLIEAGKDILTGLDTLHRYALDTRGYPASQQARVLVARVLQSATRRDDSLALALRRRNPPEQVSRPLGPFNHRLAATAAAVSTARRLLGDWLRAVPVDEAAEDDLLLIASELCANAVEHATWEDAGVVLRAYLEGTDVVLEVADDGAGLVWPNIRSDEPPDAEAEQGRGLWLVHTLADEVTPSVGPNGTTIRAVKRAVSFATG